MKEWERQEKRLARDHKGRLTPGSGNKGIKGDVSGLVFSVEAKFSSASKNDRFYIDLQKEWLDKLHKQSYKKPLLNICIGNSQSWSIITVEDSIDLFGEVPCSSHEVDLTDKSQYRVYADIEFEYTIIKTDRSDWIVLSDFMVNHLVSKKYQESDAVLERKEYRREKYVQWRRRRNS